MGRKKKASPVATPQLEVAAPKEPTFKPLEIKAEDVSSLLHFASLLVTQAQQIHRLDLSQLTTNSKIELTISEINQANSQFSARIKQDAESIQQLLSAVGELNSRLSALEMSQKGIKIPSKPN